MPSDNHEKTVDTPKKREEGSMEFGGKRSVIIDVGGGLYALKKILRADIGFFERDFMFKAGQEGAITFLSDFGKSLKDRPKVEAIREMLSQYTQRGYGNFRILRLDEDNRIAEISSKNTIEAWAFKINRDMQREPVCSYTAGMLNAICKLACSSEDIRESDFNAIEVECAAAGDAECKFIIGPTDELPKHVSRQVLPRDSASEHVLRLNEEILLKNLELQNFNLSLERQVRRKTEDLRKSEENYRRLVELSPDPILICTADGKIHTMNESGLKLLGYDTPTGLEGLNIKSVLSSGAPAWENILWRVEKEGAVRNLELELSMKNGSKIVGELSARFAELVQGRFVETIIRDITQRRNIQAQMVEAKTESEFLTDLMSHDITNFTVSATYFLDHLRKSERLTEQDRKNLAIAAKDIHGAFELATSVRDLSKIKSMSEQDVEVKELKQLIDQGTEEARRIFSDRKVVVNFDRPTEPKFIRGNAVVTRLFTNIISNAIKFNPKEEAIVDISIEDEVQKGIAYWRINISDHGKGIPDADKEIVFERFSRLDAATSGTGLGLFVVRYIAKACGGMVWAEDRVKGDYSQGVKMVVLLQKATHRQVAAVSRRRGT